VAWLLGAMQARGASGVALKDEADAVQVIANAPAGAELPPQ
jgi:hypothetical protein